ncbi:MAG: hypothetical protein C7B47_15515 [Sulfobacillus thermosulfidooxidans]|uniref:Uncharacterized protein n=1 Tax=Sulfobacillus thermosulfidooxidans TaxID=28034 RepID=A0A2T2WP45_SULTH|nr:MAG: hypothetical protein C7B47_15515 [Sulfobacillus thermosulfidooxidans]
MIIIAIVVSLAFNFLSQLAHEWGHCVAGKTSGFSCRIVLQKPYITNLATVMHDGPELTPLRNVWITGMGIVFHIIFAWGVIMIINRLTNQSLNVLGYLPLLARPLLPLDHFDGFYLANVFPTAVRRRQAKVLLWTVWAAMMGCSGLALAQQAATSYSELFNRSLLGMSILFNMDLVIMGLRYSRVTWKKWRIYHHETEC